MKLDSNLEVEWTEEFGECDGSDQLFDFVVDRLVSAKKGQKEEKYKKNLSNGDIVTGGHTVAGVINWDYLALKVGIFIDSQKLSSIFHLSLNHFVHPAKKIKKGNCCQKSTFSRLTERPTSKFGVTLMGSQEASMPGVVGKNIICIALALLGIYSSESIVQVHPR